MYGLNGGRINIGEQQKVTYAILFLDVVLFFIDSNFLVHNNAGWPSIQGLIFLTVWIILQSSQVKCTPKIPLMNLLLKTWICWIVVDCSFMSIHTQGSCESSVFLKDVNAFHQFYFKTFIQIFFNLTKYIDVIIKFHCSLCMQECRFEFETGCGKD